MLPLINLLLLVNIAFFTVQILRRETLVSLDHVFYLVVIRYLFIYVSIGKFNFFQYLYTRIIFFLQTLNHPYHLFLNPLVLYHPFSGDVNGIT